MALVPDICPDLSDSRPETILYPPASCWATTQNCGDAAPLIELGLAHLAGYLYAWRYRAPMTGNINLLGLVVDVGWAGALAQVGIYTVHAGGAYRGMPESLVIGSGNIDCAAAGVKSVAVNAVLYQGSYFIALEVNQAAPLALSHYSRRSLVYGAAITSLFTGMYRDLGGYIPLPAAFSAPFVPDDLAGCAAVLGARYA